MSIAALPPLPPAEALGPELSPQRASRRRQLGDNLRDPVVVEDAYQLQEWGEGAYRQFRPINSWQDWCVQQVVDPAVHPGPWQSGSTQSGQRPT